MGVGIMMFNIKTMMLAPPREAVHYYYRLKPACVGFPVNFLVNV
jgi:hypothetical protein